MEELSELKRLHKPLMHEIIRYERTILRKKSLRTPKNDNISELVWQALRKRPHRADTSFIVNIDDVEFDDESYGSTVRALLEIRDYIPRFHNGRIQPFNLVVYDTIDQYAIAVTVMGSTVDSLGLWIQLDDIYIFIASTYQVYVFSMLQGAYKSRYAGSLLDIKSTHVRNVIRQTIGACYAFKQLYERDLMRTVVEVNPKPTIRLSILPKQPAATTAEDYFHVIDLRNPIKLPSGDPIGTGTEKSPHNRRQHVRTYRNADGTVKKQVIIRTTKVKGGADDTDHQTIYKV